MPSKTAESDQTPQNGRGFYTPEPVRDRVIVRHMNGESNRAIARQEGIDRETVSRILSQGEVTQIREQAQSHIFELIPKAIDVYRDALDSDDARIKLAAATKLLECSQVMPKNGIEPPPPPELDAKQRYLLTLGQMYDMMLKKREVYAIPLPDEFDATGRTSDEHGDDQSY